MHRVLITLAVLAATAGAVSAQTYRDGLESLPHGLTPEERLIMHEVGRDHRETDPPSAQPVRHAAEFGRMQGVLIRYPLGISTDIVREMAEDVIVYCIVTSSQESYARSAFQNAGVNMDHVVFFNATTDSYWTRDYGPWYIYDADGDCAIVDVIYNRPRPHDDVIPTSFAAFLGIDAYGPDLTHTGGNWMADGRRIAASSELVWEENPDKTPAEIEQIVDDYLGIQTYHVVPDPNGTYIDHIDCWGKFLAIDKIMIREVPEGHSQYDEIEDVVDYFERATCAYGWPYEIYRVWTPNNQPYTNSLILNDKVLVPITGSSWDDEALAAYEAAMPGYEVLGFTGSWASTDALHCRTKGVADLELLYVYTVPLRNTADQTDPYRVNAEIIDHSEMGLIAGAQRVYWRTGESGPFSYEVMTAIAGTDSFYADIPAQPMGTTIQYYVHAEDNSGRIEDCPLVGSAAPFTFLIEIDVTAPQISGTDDLRSTDDTTGPYVVETTVTDNDGVDEVLLTYRVNEASFVEVSMTPMGDNLYRGEIPGQLLNSVVEYYIRATDISSNETLDPSDAPAHLYDFLVAPELSLLATDLEEGSDWAHGAVSGGFGDAWHLSTQRNHTPGGETSWKCGDTGAGDYASLLDAGLVTETVELEIDSRLTYWQWIDAEVSSAYTGYAYDGGLVEIDLGSGFEQITPDGGYPYLIRNAGGTGPFDPETPVFSGTEDWHLVTFDLAAFEGPAQIRFRFGSDANTGAEGWYLDDIAIDGFLIDWQTVGEVRVLLASRATNPITGASRIGFSLGSDARALLRIFDTEGRALRTLIDDRLAAGDYAVTWDGTDRGGRRVGPGVYFYRLDAGSETRAQRLVVLQ